MSGLRLDITLGKRAVGSFAVHDLLSLGRSPSNSVVLDDPGVSRFHALVRMRDGHCWIHDAGSKNGVFVGERRVPGAVLAPGDVFVIGAYRCRLAAEPEARGSPRDREPTPTQTARPEAMSEGGSAELFLGGSAVIRELLDQARRVAAAEVGVLITGESGSGKGVLARVLHRWSARARRPLIEVNCAAIPGELVESVLFGHRKGSFTGAVSDRLGKFQVADGGILFLDEVADMSAAAQAKILRAIEDGEIEPVGSTQPVAVDVRVIAATNRDPATAVREGRFREDLLYRLETVRLRVPPLRERNEDVPLLANAFLTELQASVPAAVGRTFTADAITALLDYGWPGNVRQLRNVVANALVLGRGPAIGVTDLRLPAAEPATGTELTPTASLEQAEAGQVARALAHHGWNITRTARSLDIRPDTLRRKIRRYGLKAPARRTGE